MKKRKEKLNITQPETPRPVPQPDLEQQSAADFAKHLAELFRTELGEEELFAQPPRTEPEPSEPERSPASAVSEPAEGPAAQEPEPPVEEPEPSTAEPESPPEEPEPLTAEPESPAAEPAAPAAVEPDPRSETRVSRPEPLTKRLSEELLQEPTKTVLPSFDDKPFIPPQKDPTLEELFGPIGTEGAAEDGEPTDRKLRESPPPETVREAVETAPRTELPTEPEPDPEAAEAKAPEHRPAPPSGLGKLRGRLQGLLATIRQATAPAEDESEWDAPAPEPGLPTETTEGSGPETELPAAEPAPSPESTPSETEAILLQLPPQETEAAAPAAPSALKIKLEESGFAAETSEQAAADRKPFALTLQYEAPEPDAEARPQVLDELFREALSEPPTDSPVPEEAPAASSLELPPEMRDELAAEPADQSSHAPELWDPHSLFSAPEDEGPPPLTPLSRDTTGSLPSLEDLFGVLPEAEAEPELEPEPELRVRPKKQRGWLRNLWSGVAARLRSVPEEDGDEPLEEPGPDLAEISVEPEVAALLSDSELAPAFPESGPIDSLTETAAAEVPAEPAATEAPAVSEAANATAEPAAIEAPAVSEAADATAEPAATEAPTVSEAADVTAEPAPQPETAEPAAEETEDWDPLALFGGQAKDAELPTWEEYVRASKSAQAGAEPPAAEPETDAHEAPAAKPDTAVAVPPAPASGKTPDKPSADAADAPPQAHPPIQSMQELDAYLAELGIRVEPETPAPTAELPASEIQTAAPTDTAAQTVPMDLSSPAAQPAAPRTRARNAQGKGEALTLEDFLAAAVPMEDAKPPQQKPPVKEREPGRKKAPAAETISTVRENPDGLILARSDRPEAKGEAGRNANDEARKRAREAAAPVPSADVRPSQSPKLRRPAPQQEPEPIPDEPAILHPEEAYRIYAKPLDAVGSHLILTGLFTLLSLFFTLYLSQHWSFLPEIFSGGTTVYILLALLIAMVLVNRKLYFRQWRNEHGLRPELLIGVATLFTALDCFPAASALRPPFTVVVGALLLIALWGRYDRGLGLITTVKVLRAEQLSAGVSEVQDITKGSRGLIRTEPDVDQFMSKLETRDLTDRVLRIYTPIALGVGFALTLAISIWLKRSFLWTGALVFLGSVPVTGLLAFPRLFCLLAGRLSGAQAALCGYHGAEVFGGEHSILIGDEDIFPAGSLTLNGFKVYNGNPDRVIAYAAAACRSSGSALDPVFEDLLVTHNGRHYTVDNFRFYDSGGIGASIQQDVVLLGSLDFMRRMGVHMDRGARVKQAVYMSLNGELAAVFAVRYAPPENLRKGLAAIAGNRHFKGILVTRTFLGTPGFLKAKFGIPTSAFHYPSTKERIRLSEAEMKRSGAQGAILAQDSFSGFAQAAAGGRMLRSATLGAAILTVLSGLAGLGLMAILAALPATETATAVNLLLYAAAWLAPTLLLTAWGRHF
ncbi:MAG: hypothetical protein IKQ54_06180 [Oscillospiraceae bacterium]|nr:hypothetical protein [Oscillospiraceae bacterium]